MKAFFGGSRKWVAQAPIEKIIAELPPGTVIIHGGAPGVDTIADYVARLRGFKVRRYPAQWETYGPAAGPKRNQLVLDEEHPYKDGSYINVAFLLHEDPGLGKGTKDMKQRLDKAEPYIPVKVTIGRGR